MNNFPRITLKNVKSLALGRDGRPWSATVYFDGKKVGDIIDRATGGPLDIRIPTSIQNEMRAYALSEGALDRLVEIVNERRR